MVKRQTKDDEFPLGNFIQLKGIDEAILRHGKPCLGTRIWII